MDVWKFSGISSKTNEHKSYETAYLMVKAEGSILPKQFWFETVSDETYQEATGLIGEMTVRARTIFTPNYWLPFVRGAKIKFKNGEELTLKGISEVKDKKRTLGKDNGLIGLNLMF